MSATVKATCPGCRAPLAIPAGMLGQPVRCTNCGAVVRAKPKTPPPNPATPTPLPHPAAPGVFYAPPAAPDPMPLPPDDAGPPDELDFTPSEATRGYAGRGRYRQPGGRKLVRAVAALVAAGGLVAAGVFGAKHLPGLVADPKPQAKSEPEAKPAPGSTAAAGAFPRRLLFVHAGNYLYLNPLTGAPAPGNSKPLDRTRPQAMRLALDWRVPDDQVYVVSDTDQRKDGRPPVKAVLVGAFDKFFETSRPQDRIAVYFGGHVLVKGEAVYLVPLEGDPDDDATLIPLADFYAKLAACPAGQKVVVWDVCRFNPDRGRQRPGSEPMPEAVAKALTAAPPGVQVVLTCQAGQNALEFNNLEADGPGKGVVAGSSFLEAVRVVGKRRTAKPGSPADPIPVAEWSAPVGKRVAEVAAAAEGRPEQAVTTAGTTPAELPAYDPSQPAPARFDLPPAPKGADAKEVEALVKQFALPGITTDDDPAGVTLFPYPAAVLAPYMDPVPISAVTDPANREKYQFRLKVLEALDVIREVWGRDGKPALRDSFVGETNDAVKKEVTGEQAYPAQAAERLSRQVLNLLEAVEPMRAEQPKRWQAHFDYALAQTKARIAFLQEYNLALGNIKTEVLPPRDPKRGHDGYKLVSTATMKARDAKKLAEEAREVFDRVVAEFPGTPWAVQAKRDRAQNLGLVWQPFNSKAAAKDE
ncbi:MAG: hypothetical protein K2X87_32570 [Gemmataceae bacterium]|nr:hypothetical protein [Gemmataceae bacterium]